MSPTLSRKVSNMLLPLIAAGLALAISACSSWMSSDSADTTPPASASSSTSFATSSMATSPVS